MYQRYGFVYIRSAELPQGRKACARAVVEEFAAKNGIVVKRFFYESGPADLGAFLRLIAALREDETVSVVVVPSLRHFAGSARRRDALLRYLERDSGVDLCPMAGGEGAGAACAAGDR